ncbi:PREDICTED: SNF1-related protein kinase regulatory subunit beta-2-like isoform X1 [Nicotiana attenuata]|uniref:SNF1-related protein kinase regulatory subunit beta-2-like isoform X1 n=1 Tax=Nicotiana attenuata TaxID=49451 RepID=UPI000904D661|nr:PREDICTED: SNF1-related protein kinase regulatory subunit beta-2-like isoform X1 [Nicotiana attenuata]
MKYEVGFLYYAEMGNVSGKKEEGETSGLIKNQEDEEEEYMEYAHGHGQFSDSMVQSPPHSPKAYQSPLIFTPQVPIFPLQRPDEMSMQNQSGNLVQKTMEYGEMLCEDRIPTMITWSYGGVEVAIEGSWDGWKTRDILQRTDKDFSVMKALPSGVYHYRFVVDGQWRYAPDLPFERDDMGNVFNVLDLQDSVPEVPNNTSCSEAPLSPESSYNSIPFSSEDFNEKLPDLPPLLQQTPLDLPSSSQSSMETMQKPLPAVLNHLYIQKTRSSQSMVVLSSTHRFRTKFVTAVLYKSLKNFKK